jgi:predicted HTH transcriptional regulator
MHTTPAAAAERRRGGRGQRGVVVDQTQLRALLNELISLPKETEWVEFKENDDNPEEIGEYLSALANSAALHNRHRGYIVWGIQDGTHAVVGTSFKPRQRKVGNEELENWLSRLLSPRIDFVIHEFTSGGRVVLFEVQAANSTPVRFRGNEFIRVGSYKKHLKDFPEKERALWALFSSAPFEAGVAREGVASDDVLDLIDYPAYFRLTGQRLPDGRAGILTRLAAEKVILPRGGDRYDVTNLGAALFAKDLAAFGRLGRKALRVIKYKGNSKVVTEREWTEPPARTGYAAGFEAAIYFINSQLPQNEHVGRALRAEVRMYPEEAIRELVPNALIHQDFNVTGAGPVVEIFAERMEITNPGEPLVEPLRFIDMPPQSRNEDLAGFMRRLHICEERGSGIDKVVHHIELYQLPAPDFQVPTGSTRVVLYAPQPMARLSSADRVRACYQHCCLCYVSGDMMTNSSLRKRLGIEDHNAAQASRIISDTVDEKLIRPFDPGAGNRYMKYIPFWV